MSARLDAELADRGLARSRSNAARLIAEGRVRVDGAVAEKASLRVTPEQTIEVDGDHYVSRAAHKLIAGLDGFAIDAAGRVGLDMGASTGGFTQVLLERGAARVAAVDVGHDQLAAELRADPRVAVVEGFNVRYMTPGSLVEESGIAEAPGIVTGDLSFISLSHVLPAVRAVMADDADVVLLVKPQFEVGRTGIRGGIVVDDARREGAVADVLARAEILGFIVHGILPSPVEGTHGNREALVHLRADGVSRTWTEEIRRAVR